MVKYNDEILGIIQDGESEFVEFKLSFGKETIISLSALANKKGGKVLLGVSDAKEIKGININSETVQNWLNEIKQKTEPSIIPDSQTITIENKIIVILSITEFPIKPVSFQGRYYLRKNNSNHVLSVDEIVEQRFNSLNKSFDAFNVSTKFIELEKKAIERFRELTNQTGKFILSEKIESDFAKLEFINNESLTSVASLK